MSTWPVVRDGHANVSVFLDCATRHIRCRTLVSDQLSVLWRRDWQQ
jgi:hypothetical protein